MFKDGELVILNKHVLKGLPMQVGALVKIYCKHENSTNYDWTVMLANGDLVPVKEIEIDKLNDEEKEFSKYIYPNNKVLHVPSSEIVEIVKVDYLNRKAEISFSGGGMIVDEFDRLVSLEGDSEKMVETKRIPKFIVGDKVKTKTNDHYSDRIGEVISLTLEDWGYCYGVEFVKGESTPFSDNELELIEEEIEQPQKEELGKFTEIALEIGQFTDMKNKQYGSSVDATFEVMKVLMKRYKNNDNTYTIPESLLRHILLQVRIMDKINRIFNNPSGEGDSESPYRDLGGYSLIGIDMVEGKN